MKLVSQGQQEHLKEIITQLRKAREEKTLRVEEVAIRTRIRLLFLEALEEGRFEELPEPVYVQGFIRRYADAVGLDGNVLARTFGDISLPQESEQYSNNTETKPNLHIPLAVPYILLLIGASCGLFYILHPQKTAESLQNKKTPEVSLQKKATNSIAPSSKPSPKAKTDTPIEVNVKLQDKSWIRIQADGKTIFEGKLNKGEDKTWTAKKQLTVRAGNSGAVLVSLNKSQPKILGEADRVTEITYTPEMVNSQ